MYTVWRNNTECGPFSKDQLRSMLNAKLIEYEDGAWNLMRTEIGTIADILEIDPAFLPEPPDLPASIKRPRTVWQRVRAFVLYDTQNAFRLATLVFAVFALYLMWEISSRLEYLQVKAAVIQFEPYDINLLTIPDINASGIELGVRVNGPIDVEPMDPQGFHIKN